MDIAHGFLIIAVIILGARLFGEVGARFGVPTVIGEIVAGLVLGPSLLGWVEPNATLQFLAQGGIIMLLFEVDMDTDIHHMAKTGLKPFIVANAGVAWPLLLGFLVSYYVLGMDLLPSLFIGGTLTATSIGITVRVLSELRQRHTHEAQIVIGAAVIDDVLGVLVLAFLYHFAESGEMSWLGTAQIALYVFLFMLLAPVFSKLISFIIDRFERHSASPGFLLTLAVGHLLLMSYLAHLIGAPEILGAFAAGLAMGQHFRLHVPEGFASVPFRSGINRIMDANPSMAGRLADQVKPMIHTFAPIFFVMVGVSMNLREIDWHSPFVWQMSGLLLLVSFVGKFLSGFAVREKRLGQVAIGLAMIPRGEVGLIFAQLGFAQHIISPTVYAALILVIMFSTLVPPFLLQAFYSRYGSRLHPVEELP